MINISIDIIKNDDFQFKNNYKYVIVDEFQDSSLIRSNLLKAIQNKTNCKIIVVGDDWQSIYRFSGSYINLFIDFDDYFDYAKSIKIEKTYRNSQELLDLTSDFILKNNNQLKKDLTSGINLKNPIKLIYYNNDLDKLLSFERIINDIIMSDGNNPNILVLGRNNADIEKLLDNQKLKKFYYEEFDDYRQIIYKKNKTIDIKFRTVHKSKGLEADYVILINLLNKLNGFPNKIQDDPVLNFVLSDSDNYLFAEERRLFYVALTRTKNFNYLLVPKINSSIFINELLELSNVEEIDFELDNVNIENQINEVNGKKVYITDLKCPLCEFGNVKLIHDLNKKTKYFRCTADNCKWGAPYGGDIEDLKYIKHCNNPRCTGLMVKKRTNKGNYFLGCLFYKKNGCKGEDFNSSNVNIIDIK